MLLTDVTGSTTFIIAAKFEVYISPIPVSVSCPPVAERDEPFSCSFASAGGNHPGDVNNLEAHYIQDVTPFINVSVPFTNIKSE